jgi:hypothetical protein
MAGGTGGVPLATRSELRQTRRRLSEAWERYVGSGARAGSAASGLRPEIVTSWERSVGRVSNTVAEAPLADADDVREAWERTPLRVAVSRLESELRSAAEDGGLVVAVSDPGTRILWTCEGSFMRRRAEGVNFVPGGRWDERSVGTNALDLATRFDKTVTVYSAEHFSACVHDWTCWAAPIHDPGTGRQLGVLDMSTTWDKNHPMGVATVTAFARLLEQALPVLTPPSMPAAAAPAPQGMLELRLLGRSEATLDGLPLLLTRRQVEIVALLALYPGGLRLDALHAQLYGDRRVAPATLKAEVSRLRSVLGGAIASRPYRITVPVRCDAVDVLDLLRSGRLLEAAAAYGGELLAGTDAPGLAEYGNYLAVAVREALLAEPDPDAVLRYAEAVPGEIDVLERAIGALGHASHPALPLLRARLDAAYRV